MKAHKLITLVAATVIIAALIYPRTLDYFSRERYYDNLVGEHTLHGTYTIKDWKPDDCYPVVEGYNHPVMYICLDDERKSYCIYAGDVILDNGRDTSVNAAKPYIEGTQGKLIGCWQNENEIYMSLDDNSMIYAEKLTSALIVPLQVNKDWIR